MTLPYRALPVDAFGAQYERGRVQRAVQPRYLDARRADEERLQQPVLLRREHQPALELDRDRLDRNLDRPLNDTDWNVLNILLEDPAITNRGIAEKAHLSVDGIGSSLRRMYQSFDIKETKYKKMALLHAAMKVSAVKPEV